MIYLKHTTDLQMLYIPKGVRNAVGNVHLKVFSTINQAEYSYVAIDEDNSILYHKVLLQLEESMQSGEYEYTFSDEMGVLSVGILVIGELEKPLEYYNTTEYEQYTE